MEIRVKKISNGRFGFTFAALLLIFTATMGSSDSFFAGLSSTQAIAAEASGEGGKSGEGKPVGSTVTPRPSSALPLHEAIPDLPSLSGPGQQDLPGQPDHQNRTSSTPYREPYQTDSGDDNTVGSYPEAKPLQIINPFDQKDETSQLLAMLEPYYFDLAKQPFAITPKMGRAGADAWSALQSAKADGYTASIVVLPNLILRGLQPDPIYKAAEIKPICLLADLPLVLWVPADSPFTDFNSFWRKAQNSPPETFTIAGGGSYSGDHIGTLRLNRAAGFVVRFAPYMGTEDAMLAAKQGKVNAAWGYTLVEPGASQKMRPLAIASSRRNPALPKTPTFSELGCDFVFYSQFGIAVPDGTNPAIKDLLQKYFLKIMENPEFKKGAIQAGFIIAPQDSTQITSEWADRMSRWQDVLQDFGLN